MQRGSGINLGRDSTEEAEYHREEGAVRAERIAIYAAFVAQNGGRLGDDLAGILAGTRQPSGQPAPVTPPSVGRKRLMAETPCSRCGRSRYRPVDPASDDGICGQCREKDRPARRVWISPLCERCGRGRRKQARDGLCGQCRRLAVQERRRARERQLEQSLEAWKAQQEAAYGDGTMAGEGDR